MVTAGMAGTKRAAQLLLLAGCLALGVGVAPARGAPSVDQMLKFAPRQQGVNYTTPSVRGPGGNARSKPSKRSGQGERLAPA